MKSALKNFLTVFLSYGGYYVVLGLIIAAGQIDLSRQFTMPLRLLSTFAMFVVLLRNGHLFAMITQSRFAKAMLVISALYLLRVVYESVTFDDTLHKTPSDMLMYFVAFGVVPFFFFLQPKDVNAYRNIYITIIVSTVILSLLAIYLYLDILLDGVARINQAKTDTKEDLETLSPLALSYASIHGIGLALVSYLFVNTPSFKLKWLLLPSAMLLATVPFLLGASRGSVIALILPFIMISVWRGGQGIWRMAIVFVPALIGIFYISLSTGGGIVARLTNTFTKFDSGEAVDGREYYYITSWIQFLESPIVGNSLQNKYVAFYPHNIFFEVMITMGMLGLVPFLFLCYQAYKQSKRVVKQLPHLTWVVVLFWQAFFQHMFSGAFYSAIWFWAGIALLLSTAYYVKQQPLVHASHH